MDGYSRELNVVVKIKGLPFRSTSRVYKVQTYKKDGDKYEMRAMNKTLDVPYGNDFQVEEKWEITPVEG